MPSLPRLPLRSSAARSSLSSTFSCLPGKSAVDIVGSTHLNADLNVHQYLLRHVLCSAADDCGSIQANALQGDAEKLPKKVGIVRERCAAITRAPRDNRAAIGIQLTKVLRSPQPRSQAESKKTLPCCAAYMKTASTTLEALTETSVLGLSSWK